MTRDQLVTIWRNATGLPFHPGSATERGLRAVLEVVADEFEANAMISVRKILDDSVNTK